MERIERLWVLTDGGKPRAELLPGIEGTRFAAVPAAGFPGNAVDHIYLVDPLRQPDAAFSARSGPFPGDQGSAAPAEVHGAPAMKRLALAALLLTFVVVVVGAYVRLSDAGLGCPDWPLCYGKPVPDAMEDAQGLEGNGPSLPRRRAGAAAIRAPDDGLENAALAPARHRDRGAGGVPGHARQMDRDDAAQAGDRRPRTSPAA